jgi:lysozyme family protein
MALPRSRARGIAAAIIAATIALEGGYVRNNVDPGGETNFGITKATANRNGYYGPMRSLPRETAESIYYSEYLVRPGYEPLISIDAPVAAELFDTTVNMGAPRPSRWFQQSINELCPTTIAVDGHVGPAAIAAYRYCQPHRGAAWLCVAMLNSLDAKQGAEYRRLVAVNPKLRVFLKGWLANRIGNVDRRNCNRGH